MSPIESWLRYEHQVRARDPADLADELGVCERKMRTLLSEYEVGTTKMLLHDPYKARLLIEEHGSADLASKATGISCSRIMKAV